MAQTRSQFNGSVPPRRYADILERLTALEAELADASKGTGLPADPQLTQLVTQSLVNNYPHADIQIVVSSSRKSTTTKQCYETETPGMVGLDTEKLRELQKQLMEKISLPGFDTKAPKTNGNDAKNGMSHEVSSDPVQHKSSVEEVFADEDGTQVISKKLTRIVTTSHSAISGIGNDQNDGKYGSGSSQQQLRLQYQQQPIHHQNNQQQNLHTREKQQDPHYVHQSYPYQQKQPFSNNIDSEKNAQFIPIRRVD